MQYSGIDDHDAGHHPGGRQVGDRADAHHLERVDLLADPHGAQLRGGAGADGGRQADGGDQRRRQGGC